MTTESQNAAYLLQWGRGWLAAEGRLNSTRPNYSSSLQWGRGWLAAEGVPASTVLA